MRGRHLELITGLLAAVAAQAPVPTSAKPAAALIDPIGGSPSAGAPGVLQCVPFARATSGIQLYGDAHTWWSQAEGKYSRGHAPRPGAVMAITPHGGSTLGHVATVRRVIDSRTILIDHANWSAPGMIERNVTAVDVSPANDWSEVRVWFAPIQNLGSGHWPVAGFIYGKKAATRNLAKAALFGKQTSPVDTAKPTMVRYVPSKTVKVRFGIDPGFVPNASAPNSTPLRKARKPFAHMAEVRPANVRLTRTTGRHDPIGMIIASAR